MSYKGWFNPKNREKYRGDVSNIVYRSNWELIVMKQLDLNPNVIWWNSEELVIRYKSPVDQKIHRYFPDFVARVKTKSGIEKTYVLEVKPYKQTIQPVQKKRTKRFLTELTTYAVNQEKWRAADLFCREHGWEFKILTEKEIGI